MQTTFCFFDLPVSTVIETKEVSTRLTPRDLDILEFALSMKFVTLEQIHRKFFRLTKSGSISDSFRWVRERVSILLKTGFLESVKNICAKTLYIGTKKSYFYLKNTRTSIEICRPIPEVDRRTFEHDFTLTELRIHLEETKIATTWNSDRFLSDSEQYTDLFTSEYRPDAIYISPTGTRVALELEISRKSKERYKQKTRRYIQQMTQAVDEFRPFDHVHYICERTTVRDLIFDQIQLFQPLFSFNLITDYLPTAELNR